MEISLEKIKAVVGNLYLRVDKLEEENARLGESYNALAKQKAELETLYKDSLKPKKKAKK